MRMVTAILVGFVVALAIGGAARFEPAAESQGSTGAVAPAMAGNWTGDARIVVSWATQKTLPVRLNIAPDGAVSGTIGDAVLRDGRLERNRTALGRMLHVKTDWIVRGTLEGDVVKAEGIHRDRVSVPLNWIDDHFEGGVNTSGSQFGGKDSMVLTAQRLRLERR